MNHAHRPEPRWRWYAGLALDTVVLVALFLAVIFAASLSSPVPA